MQPYILKMNAMDWLKNHVFIAAWISPVVALVGLLLRKPVEGSSLNWSKIMIYVGFLTGLAILVTPGIDANIRASASSLVFIGLGYLIVDSRMNR